MSFGSGPEGLRGSIGWFYLAAVALIFSAVYYFTSARRYRASYPADHSYDRPQPPSLVEQVKQLRARSSEIAAGRSFRSGAQASSLLP
jgi:hypothetical protein